LVVELLVARHHNPLHNSSHHRDFDTDDRKDCSRFQDLSVTVSERTNQDVSAGYVRVEDERNLMSETPLEPSVTNPDADGTDEQDVPDLDPGLEPDPQHEVDPTDVPEGGGPT
jgi:hypothetical protein